MRVQFPVACASRPIVVEQRSDRRTYSCPDGAARPVSLKRTVRVCSDERELEHTRTQSDAQVACVDMLGFDWRIRVRYPREWQSIELLPFDRNTRTSQCLAQNAVTSNKRRRQYLPYSCTRSDWRLRNIFATGENAILCKSSVQGLRS